MEEASSGGGLVHVQKIPAFKYKDDYLDESNKTGWTCFPAQNLTAVLSDPRAKGRQADFFTKQWGETFIPTSVTPLPLLGCVPRIYFEDFIKKYEFKQMQHEKLKKLCLQPHAEKKSQLKNTQKSELAPPEQDTPPDIFFQHDFNLEDPGTFKEVSNLYYLEWKNL